MSVTADRRVDVEVFAGVVDVGGVASFRQLSRCRSRRPIRLAADGSPTFLLEVVQIFLTSIFSVAVDWKLGSHFQ